MPIYEYRCGDCGRRVNLYFQTFSAAANAGPPTCDFCQGQNLSRLVSRVFQARSEDARLDELADPSAFAGLDENDPKSVARWARRLGSEMGEDLGDDWDEMVDRIEAGEDLGDGDAPMPGLDEAGVGAGDDD